jgi:hypothetical protein
LQVIVLGHESSPIELFMEMHVCSDDRQKRMQQFVDSQAQRFVVCWFSTIFFLSYYLLEFDEFIFFISRRHITIGRMRDTGTIL